MSLVTFTSECSLLMSTQSQPPDFKISIRPASEKWDVRIPAATDPDVKTGSDSSTAKRQ